MTIPDKPRSKWQRYRLAAGHDAGQGAGQDMMQDTGKDGAEFRLLRVMAGEMTRRQMQDALGLKHRDHFSKTYLLPTLRAGLIEMTIPDKPRSRSQRYRLAPAGTEYLRHVEDAR